MDGEAVEISVEVPLAVGDAGVVEAGDIAEDGLVGVTDVEVVVSEGGEEGVVFLHCLGVRHGSFP